MSYTDFKQAILLLAASELLLCGRTEGQDEAEGIIRERAENAESVCTGL